MKMTDLKWISRYFQSLVDLEDICEDISLVECKGGRGADLLGESNTEPASLAVETLDKPLHYLLLGVV